MVTSEQTALTAQEAAHGRVSIRRYVQGALSRAELEALLSAAAQAPSAYNVQPWRFVVVQEPDLKARLQEAAYGQPQVGAAPAVIVLYTDMQDVLAHADELVSPETDAEKRAAFVAKVQEAYGGLDPQELEAFGTTQGGIVLGYLLLLAASMGLGTSPMQGFDPERVRTLLGLPGHVRIPALVAVGRPAEEGGVRHRHTLERLVSWR
ncbi:MAG: nitroreductase family protein [Candidatus Sericytochromatia bacterium]|nr:nitroreductase family protein [Candidatus Sericytochromatia bacterium]